MQKRMRNQKGAVSIEFVFVFIVFFMLFYGMVSLTFPLLLRATYEELSSEALREAIAVHTVNQNTQVIPEDPEDPKPVEADYTKKASDDLNNIKEAVTSVLEESWLPPQWRQPCSSRGYDGDYFKREEKAGTIEWSVCIGHNNPASIIPQISLLGLDIIKLPDSISGRAITAFNK